MEETKNRYSPFEIEQREWKQRQTKERLKQMLTIASPIFLLFLWEFLSRTGLIDIRFFPPPSAIVGTFLEMLLNGELVNHIGVSMYRIFRRLSARCHPRCNYWSTNGTLLAQSDILSHRLSWR